MSGLFAPVGWVEVRNPAYELDNGYSELPITSEHAVFLSNLPPLHKDPFDRILIAQATVEGFTLLTADSVIAEYPGSIRKV